jgi:hypothetical protein
VNPLPNRRGGIIPTVKVVVPKVLGVVALFADVGGGRGRLVPMPVVVPGKLVAAVVDGMVGRGRLDFKGAVVVLVAVTAFDGERGRLVCFRLHGKRQACSHANR